MRLAVYTTAFPAVCQFLPEWYSSVASQSDPEFDLWVGLDGIDEEAFFCAIKSNPPVHFVHGLPNGSPADVRSRAILQMAGRYEGIVFADADDILCPSRVVSARQCLDKWDVTACALAIIDEHGSDLELIFGPSEGNPVDHLARYNAFGLSNTSWRSAVLERCLPVQNDCVLMDWLLATRAWSLGADLHYDPVPRMKYRQYGRNTAVVAGPFTPALILQAALRVLHHYRCALDPSWPLRDDIRRMLESTANELAEFYGSVTASAETLQAYTVALNRAPRQYVWWWGVAHPDLKAIWKR